MHETIYSIKDKRENHQLIAFYDCTEGGHTLKFKSRKLAANAFDYFFDINRQSANTWFKENYPNKKQAPFTLSWVW